MISYDNFYPLERPYLSLENNTGRKEDGRTDGHDLLYRDELLHQKINLGTGNFVFLGGVFVIDGGVTIGCYRYLDTC